MSATNNNNCDYVDFTCLFINHLHGELHLKKIQQSKKFSTAFYSPEPCIY